AFRVQADLFNDVLEGLRVPTNPTTCAVARIPNQIDPKFDKSPDMHSTSCEFPLFSSQALGTPSPDLPGSVRTPSCHPLNEGRGQSVGLPLSVWKRMVRRLGSAQLAERRPGFDLLVRRGMTWVL